MPSENWFFSYPFEAMFAKENGALSDEDEGMEVTDPAEVPSSEGVVCHDDERRGDMLPPRLTFMDEENASAPEEEGEDPLKAG